jgi:hypothetical protein
MKGKKRLHQDMKRLAISSTEKSIDELEEIANQLGMGYSSTVSFLFKEYIGSAELRKEFEKYINNYYQLKSLEEGKTGVYRNYMFPTEVLLNKHILKAREKYMMSDFVRNLIYFCYDRKILKPDVNLEKAVFKKFKKAGLKVVGYNQYGKVLDVQVDISHLFDKK